MLLYADFLDAESSGLADATGALTVLNQEIPPQGLENSPQMMIFRTENFV